MSVKSFGDKTTLKGDVYIGIDQSYTGFGITAIDKKGNYYTEVYKAEGSGIEKLCNIRNYLEDFLSEHTVVRTAMEGYAFGREFGVALSGELAGMVKLLLFDLYPSVPEARFPLVVQPSTLKKYITGKGRVDKNQVLLQVFKKWGVEFNDDNAADSYGLARIIRNKHEFEYEKEVYAKLITK